MGVRTIRWPEDGDAILAHLQAAFDPEDADLLAATYGLGPGFDPANCHIVENEDGEIIAHAMVIPRQLQIGESLLSAGEIAAFSVLDGHQGRGHEDALLRALHLRMTEREDALGLAFGDPALLEAWGYTAAVGLYMTAFEPDIPLALALNAGSWRADSLYEQRMAERLGAQNQAVTVRRFYINDLLAVQTLYATASAKGFYLVARDEAAWNWQLDHLGRSGHYEPDDFLVAEVDGSLVAYVRLVTQGPANPFGDSSGHFFSVIEAAGTHPDAIEALLAEVARTAQTFGAERISLLVHPQSVFMEHALARGAALRQFTGAGYVRLNHLPLALYQMQAALDTRRLNSRFAYRTCRLVITTEHDQAEVQLGAGEAEIIELEAPSVAVVRLLTGWSGIESLVGGYHERHADLLRVLFPRRDPKIGLADVL